MSFLSKHTGMPFTADEIQEGCGFPLGSTERSRVIAALGHLTRSGSGIQSFTRGAWTYTGNHKTAVEKPVESDLPGLAEVIGKLMDGSLIAKGDDGNIYRIERI